MEVEPRSTRVVLGRAGGGLVLFDLKLGKPVGTVSGDVLCGERKGRHHCVQSGCCIHSPCCFVGMLGAVYCSHIGRLLCSTDVQQGPMGWQHGGSSGQ